MGKHIGGFSWRSLNLFHFDIGQISQIKRVELSFDGDGHNLVKVVKAPIIILKGLIEWRLLTWRSWAWSAMAVKIKESSMVRPKYLEASGQEVDMIKETQKITKRK